MPFKLCQNRRAGHYELSREMYVVSVQLLDGNVLQCSLASESSGQVCLDYVCLRLNLGQSVFFGLRCRTNRLVYRWIELDKPLRKQFDKSEQNHLQLYFGVIFHTPNVCTLTDEVTRYYFYLQMRADILEGRLLVSPQKAILLASYSLQVDLGDFNEARHTLEVFRDWRLLPKHLTQSPQILEDLIGQVILGYNSLQGLSQRQAELLYISEAQQCEGYGEEYFPGKDEDGNDVFVGYYSEGIIVKRLQGPPLKYRWEEVRGIHSNKRNFTVDCAELSNLCFQMEDAETAKYAAFLFSLQSKFFRCLSATERKMDPLAEADLNSFSRFIPVPMEKDDGIHIETRKRWIMGADSASMHHLNIANDRLVLPTDRKAFSSTNLSRSVAASANPLLASAKDVSGSPNLSRSRFDVAANSGCVLMTNSSNILNTNVQSVVDMLGRVKLPSYRNAPDYETALGQPSLDEYNAALWRDLRDEQQRRMYISKPLVSMSSQSLISCDTASPMKHSQRSLENAGSNSSDPTTVGKHLLAAGRPIQCPCIPRHPCATYSSPDLPSAWWPPKSSNQCTIQHAPSGYDVQATTARRPPASPVCMHRRSHQHIAVCDSSALCDRSVVIGPKLHQ